MFDIQSTLLRNAWYGYLVYVMTLSCELVYQLLLDVAVDTLVFILFDKRLTYHMKQLISVSWQRPEAIMDETPIFNVMLQT